MVYLDFSGRRWAAERRYEDLIHSALLVIMQNPELSNITKTVRTDLPNDNYPTGELQTQIDWDKALSLAEEVVEKVNKFKFALDDDREP